MKIKMITKFTLVVFIVLLLTSCDMGRNLVKVEETIKNIEFKTEKTLLDESRTYLIDTDSQTYVWGVVSFIELEKGMSKITYEKDSDGNMYNGKIYLTKEDIKNYSKKYADAYGETLEITNE